MLGFVVDFRLLFCLIVILLFFIHLCVSFAAVFFTVFFPLCSTMYQVLFALVAFVFVCHLRIHRQSHTFSKLLYLYTFFYCRTHPRRSDGCRVAAFC